MSNSVRYTAAKRREVAAARAAKLVAEDRVYAAMTVEEYLAARRVDDRLIWAEDDAPWYVAHHAELVAMYGPVADACAGDIEYETTPDYCPVCHAAGMAPCYDEAGQIVPDHDGRPTAHAATGGE